MNKFPDHPTGAEDPSPYFLRLGYEDDKYKDNGYDKHDDGTDNQCVLKEDPGTDGRAWLEVRMIHHDDPSGAGRTPDPLAPFDLWWDRVDDNFSKLTLYRGSATFPDSSLTLYTGTSTGVVTYKGKIYFDVSNNLGVHPAAEETSEEPFTGKIGDGDYDWFLATQSDNGFAEGNKISSCKAMKDQKLPPGLNALALEFSSRETVDRIKDSSWWKDFHYKVDKKPDEAIKMVKGKEVIVIGLIGFDNEHGDREEGARVELHPVYGMAIHTKNTETDPDLLEDEWVIVARNWGNQGSCSNGWDLTHSKWQHYLGLVEDKMRFFLPAKVGPSTIVSPDFHTNYGEASCKFKTQSFNDGVLVTIQLPEPENKKLFWGELHIKKEPAK